MATPHRSRYSRPLKATLPYTGCSTTKGMPSSGTAAGSPTGTAVGGRRGSGERRASPERKSPVTAATGKDEEANAKGTFNDPDCYMNSLWPRIPSSQQFEVEALIPIEGDDVHFYHRRSNSCSGSDNNTVLHKVHTCKSIEGLNQEISAVLDGKDLGLTLQHPDGHIAPVKDLLASTVGTPVGTPNQSVLSGPSSPAASPYWPPMASSHAHAEDPPHSHSLLVQDGGISGQVGEGCTSGQAGDGFSSDGVLPTNHPHSPKPSFVAREPPDGAERCCIKQESRMLATDIVLGGPDKSKGNIVFRGSAFAPLLASNTIKVPIDNTACT